MDWALLSVGFSHIFTPGVMLMVLFGCIGGILVGALPGMTATMAVALLVPFTFKLELTHSLGMLLGIYCGGMYGGSISAILIRTPGTPAAAATLIDGYPMGQKGEASRALSMALFASFCGGMIGALLMTFLSPPIAKFALKFSNGEYFALALFGLSIIVSISGKSVVKGLMAAFFGLCLCSIGSDPISGYPRFLFGQMGLYEGPPFIPTLIGLFALSEVFSGVEKILKTSKIPKTKIKSFPTLADIKTCAVAIIRSAGIGAFIGCIPGAGGDIAAFVSYGETKRYSKHPEKFGTGVIEGVASPEAANNACSGGAMIPLLSLGVPGDAVTAVLLGAFTMQGLQPGPLLYQEHLDIVYNVFACMIVANICMLIVGALGLRVFARIITVDKKILLPVIVILSLVGSYSMRNSMFDVFVSITFGVIGFILQRYDFPLAPILLSLILGPMAESNLRRALVKTDGSFFGVINTPICIVFLSLAVFSLVTSFISQTKVNKKLAAEEESEAAKAAQDAADAQCDEFTKS